MTVVCSGNTFIDILKKHVEDNNVKLTSYKFLLDLKGLNHQGSCGQRFGEERCSGVAIRSESRAGESECIVTFHYWLCTSKPIRVELRMVITQLKREK